MDQVRWGILGAAKIAREWVCPGIHTSDRGTVAAVASRTPGKAEALAAPYGARTHASYEALLDDPGIDAIYIPLPNGDHVEWTLKALDAGKHVLTEKPIALEAAEIDRLIAARDRAGKLAAEAFMVTHHPQWLRTRELVRGGAIGRLAQVQCGFTFMNRDPANIRNDARLGGGALRDIGVYPTVTTRFVTGAEPVAVTRAEIDWDMGIDATARVMAAFPDFHLDFYVSMRMAPRQVMVFHGEDAVLTVRAPFNAYAYADQEIELRAADGRITIERFGQAEQYRAQADAFHASVLDGAPYGCPLEFSRGNQRFIDMIYAAAGPGPT
jgi:predicted dehydrogenase